MLVGAIFATAATRQRSSATSPVVNTRAAHVPVSSLVTDVPGTAMRYDASRVVGVWEGFDDPIWATSHSRPSRTQESSFACTSSVPQGDARTKQVRSDSLRCACGPVLLDRLQVTLVITRYLRSRLARNTLEDVGVRLRSMLAGQAHAGRHERRVELPPSTMSGSARLASRSNATSASKRSGNAECASRHV